MARSGRGVEDVVAPCALVASLNAFGKVVGRAWPGGQLRPSARIVQPVVYVRRTVSKRSADLLAVPVQNGQLVRHILGTE